MEKQNLAGDNRQIKVIAPKGCAQYLTPDKEYCVLELNYDGFRIKSDNCGEIYCCWNNCCHLYGGDWIIKYEPKSGDIVSYSDDGIIAIFTGKYGNNVTTGLGSGGKLIINGIGCQSDEIIRPATPAESEKLFSELAKIGKKWNPETTQIENIV